MIAVAQSALADDAAPLALTRTIPLPGVEGRIDHFAFDARGERLFVCALGNNSVEVIDLRKGERVHSISGLGSPQGVAYLPESDRIIVANDKRGACKIFDGTSFASVAEITLGDDADNVRYDAERQQVLVGFGRGGIAVIDALAMKQLGSIDLPAHPEAFALENNGARIFANIPNRAAVAVIDRAKSKVVATWRTDLAAGNFPMALDEADHRLFVGCRLPARLLVFNTDSGEIVSKLEISADADDLFYDSKRHRIYAICGEGKLDVIAQNDAKTFTRLTSLESAEGARTGLYVPERDALFVAVPRRGASGAEIRIYAAGRSAE